VAVKQSAQGWKTQSGVAACKGAERCLDSLIGVMVTVPCRFESRTFAQPGQGVSVAVNASTFISRVRGEQYFPVLGGHHKDQAVDEPEKLAEVIFLRQRGSVPVGQSGAQDAIIWMLEEAGPEFVQRHLDTVAKP